MITTRASAPTKAKLNGELKHLQEMNLRLRERLRTDDFELARAREHLSSMVEDQKKMGEQLRQASKMKSINTLACSIAHDLNNFLSVVSGSTALMRQELGDPHMLEKEINVIDDTVEEAASLLRQLLSIGREHTTNRQVTDINHWLTGIVKWVENFLPKELKLVLDLDPMRPHVFADVRKLNQLLLNLCANAKDAMGTSGAIRLTTKAISASELEGRFPDVKAQSYVRISVADNGEGMDDETRDRIFEPFFTTKDPGKGTGLGLSICYRIIKSHEGYIDVESQRGHGTTLYIYFPALSIF